jgi:hypothetical protein
MELSMPKTVPETEPGSVYVPRPFTFTHIPDLRELLPKFRGRPGFEYLQCCVANLRRAQDEGWTEVENTVIYTIEGPKGEASMKLLARGKPIPGATHNAGARLCVCDKSVEGLTGVWINPHRHEESPEVPDLTTSGDETTCVDLTTQGGPATPKRVEEPKYEVGTSDSNVNTAVNNPPDETPVFRSGGGPSAA